MERINVMVSDEAKEKLVKYKIKEKYSSLDKALDQYLLNSHI